MVAAWRTGGCANNASVTSWAAELNAKGSPQGRVTRAFLAVTDDFHRAIEGRTLGQ
jgi:hypothetical protein